MQAISDQRLDLSFAAQYVDRHMAAMDGYEPEKSAAWVWPACSVHQGEPFAECLRTRGHRDREGVWL